DTDDAILVSAKEGIGIQEVLEAIVKNVPQHRGDHDAPLRALIFDSWFDSYQGVIVLIRIVDGKVREGDRIKMMSTDKVFIVTSVGLFTPKMRQVGELTTGEVGYLAAAIKKVLDTKIGDTITSVDNPAQTPLPGYKAVKPMVFCGLYTVDSSQYEELRDALDKLRLNDSSFTHDPETSLALGFGFRCGFLGLLHMEIIQERLEREYNLNLISTAPTVVYSITTNDGAVVYIDNPYKLPPPNKISRFEEPYILGTIITPEAYLGQMLALCQEKRGIQKELAYLDIDRVILKYEIPLNEVILDFYDKLKSMSRGYASFDYEFIGYRDADLVKIDILLNGETVDALSFIAYKEKAVLRGRHIAEKMREVIPRQLFDVAIQAAINSRIIARETVKALKKDVTAKCYGGDISRKRKLWEKQKEGKKRMKQVGRVEIPQEAFLTLLKVKD
ncbi:MAG: translation elongation factor 4, partial [Nitrospirota bacterium]